MNMDKAHELIKESMGRVKQEILIRTDDGDYIVYIQDISMKPNGEVSIEFSTPNEDMKDILYPHVVQCIKNQIEEYTKERRWKLSRLFSRT